MTDRCPQGHPTPTAAHRDSQGYCRRCRSDGAKAQRLRARNAVAFVRALEDITPEELAARIAALPPISRKLASERPIERRTQVPA